MLTLWLALDIVALLVTGYLAEVLSKHADTPSTKLKMAIRVVAVYSILVLSTYIYMAYDSGYTLVGALLFGGVIASIHIFLLGGFVMINLS